MKSGISIQPMAIVNLIHLLGREWMVKEKACIVDGRLPMMLLYVLVPIAPLTSTRELLAPRMDDNDKIEPCDLMDDVTFVDGDLEISSYMSRYDRSLSRCALFG